MFDRLLDILGNSHFEAYIGGPIAGILASMLFAAFGNSSNNNLASQSPRDIHIFITNQYNHSHSRRSTNSSTDDDASGLLVGAFIAFIVVCLLFAAYLPQISFALCFFITAVATFSVLTCIFAWFSGRFHTITWWRHTVFPFLVSLGCFAVAIKAEQAISPDIVRYAQALLGSEQLTLSRVLNAAIVFFKNLSSSTMLWLGHQLVAYIFVLLSALGALLQCLHYVALANVQAGNSTFWTAIAMRTMRYRGAGYALSTAILLGVAWLFASGTAYRFLYQ